MAHTIGILHNDRSIDLLYNVSIQYLVLSVTNNVSIYRSNKYLFSVSGLP